MKGGLAVVAVFFALAFVNSAAAADLALTHARIYASPDALAIDDGTLLIREGRIRALGPTSSIDIPSTAKVVDLQGRVVTAGFWNSHVHLIVPALLKAKNRSSTELSQLLTQMFLRWGFTSVFDISSQLDNTLAIRGRVNAGTVVGPAILTVGDPFFPKDGTPIYVKQFMKDNGFPDEEIGSLPDAVARAHRQIREGADGVKLFTGAIVGGDIGVLPMPIEQATALAAAAHADGKSVFAHPSNLAGLNVAIDSGVDILAHTTPDGGPWSSETAARVAAHHMALIPTLTLFDVELRRAKAPEDEIKRFMDTAVQQVDSFSKAGGQILFGTDVGYIEVFDTTEEFQQMGRALDWRQILKSLTAAPAQRFGYAERKGRLQAGMDADLVVLQADPAKDVTAFAHVQMTVRHGKTLYEAAE